MNSPQKSVAAISALAIAIAEGRSARELIYISDMLSLLSHAVKTIAIGMLDLEKGGEK